MRAETKTYTGSNHDSLGICARRGSRRRGREAARSGSAAAIPRGATTTVPRRATAVSGITTVSRTAAVSLSYRSVQVSLRNVSLGVARGLEITMFGSRTHSVRHVAKLV